MGSPLGSKIKSSSKFRVLLASPLRAPPTFVLLHEVCRPQVEGGFGKDSGVGASKHLLPAKQDEGDPTLWPETLGDSIEGWFIPLIGKPTVGAEADLGSPTPFLTITNMPGADLTTLKLLLLLSLNNGVAADP